jgi:hypothetical protein
MRFLTWVQLLYYNIGHPCKPFKFKLYSSIGLLKTTTAAGKKISGFLIEFKTKTVITIGDNIIMYINMVLVYKKIKINKNLLRILAGSSEQN